jgi:hypothetical protein
MSQRFVVGVLEGVDGELYIQLPDEVIENTAWKPDDIITWAEQPNGSFLLRKSIDDSSNEA